MSLQELFYEANRPEYAERSSWYRELARRALAEANDPLTPVRLCQTLLEGGLSPWILGYDFYPRDGCEALMWLVVGGVASPAVGFPEIQKLYEDREPRCQEVWNGEHVAYRCLTCGLSSNSCMCVYCFDAEQHAGHDYRLYRSATGGCCDCGDPLAWKPSGFCKRHSLPDAPLPSKLPPIVQVGARIAIRAVVLHLVWSLRRCFNAGKLRPEASGAYGVARCIAWLNEVQGVCPDLCKLVGEVLNERRDVCLESAGWGNFCPAFSAELVMDDTATRALMRLGCYLPPAHASELTSLFLKLLLDADFKVLFTNAFVDFNDDMLCLLGACNPERPARAQQIGEAGMEEEPRPDTQHDQLDAMGDNSDDDLLLRKYLDSFPFPNPAAPPPHYSAPKHPRVFSNEVLSFNAKRFLDRIYCQLIHSESVALPHSPVLLTSMLRRLDDHFKACIINGTEPGAGVLIQFAKIKRSFHRRIFSQLDLIFQHDSVCEVLLRDQDRLSHFLNVLRSCQLLNCLRRRQPHEQHVLMPDPYQHAFNLYFELEERMMAPILRTCKVMMQDDAKLDVLNALFAQTFAVLESWTTLAMTSVLSSTDCGSLHCPLTRFFFRLVDLFREHRPEYLKRFDLKLDVILQFCMPSLRAVNLMLEVQDGIWVRNGQTMLNSVLWYLKIFSAGTFEADLLVLRSPFLLFDPFDPKTMEQIVRTWKTAFVNEGNHLRVMGCIALQGSNFTSVKRAALHWLASRECTFSEIESMSPPAGSHRNLEKVLEEIALFQDASTHPGGLPAHYKLKPAEWDFVELGNFYLRYLRNEEENALTRYKRARGLDPERPFVPVPRFPLDDPVCRSLLTSPTLFGACLEVFSLSNRDEHVISAALLCVGALEAVAGSGDCLLPIQTLRDLLEHHAPLVNALPNNVLTRLKGLLTVDRPAEPLGSSMEVVEEGSSTASTQTSEEMLRKQATKAQQKALKAFAKKQKNFTKVSPVADMDEDMDKSGTSAAPVTTVEPTGTPVKHAEVEVCALCRKSAEDASETLGMMAFREGTNLLRVRESIALEGEGICSARAPSTSAASRCPVPAGIAPEDPDYVAPKSLLTCLETMRYHLDEESDLGRTELSRQHLTAQLTVRNVIHTCGHCVHPTCLEQYRMVVIDRARNGHPYEGMNVIRLDSRELFCPVCRRVTNVLVPLPAKKEILMQDRPELQRSLMEENSHMTDVDWFSSRLDDILGGPMFDTADLSFDPAITEVRSFFEECPAMVPLSDARVTAEHSTPAELLLTMLHTCDGDSDSKPPLSITKILPLVMDLALRHPHQPKNDEEAVELGCVDNYMRISWNSFVRSAFYDGAKASRSSKRRRTALSQDPSLLFLNWILLCDLRFETSSSPKVLEEAKRALRFILIFARLQDALIRAAFWRNDEEDVMMPAAEADAKEVEEVQRAAALTWHFAEMDSHEVFHRLIPREREQLARLSAQLRDAAFGSQEHMVLAFRTALKEFIPQDAPPFPPSCSFDRLDSKEEQLKRHAVLLFGPEVLAGEHFSEEAKAIAARYVEQTVTQFLRELKELVGHSDRPMGSSLVMHRLRYSALLPRLYPRAGPLLVRLPREYAAFTVAYIARKAICKRCNRPPETPGVCLMCGQIICCSADCCKDADKHPRSDELFRHGRTCARGAGESTGVFLIVNSGVVIVLLGHGRHCALGALYLDAHNEEDRNLARGKPLFLNKERLNALEESHRTQSWLLQSKMLDHVKNFLQ